MSPSRCAIALGLLGLCSALPSRYPSVPMKGVDGTMRMPLIGVGTWLYDNKTAADEVRMAFGMGYRHVDTALVYGNHVGVGQALKDTGLDRSEYFVTTKIPGGLSAKDAEASMDQCLDELQTDYVDLMLVHFPADWDGIGGPAARKEQWLAMEKWAKSGKAKAIGVSHYCKNHILDIFEVATLPIAVNQVEYHVGMGQAGDFATDFRQWVQSQGIVYQSFSSLCGPCDAPDNKELITGELVTEIGRNHKKSGAQVALRWLTQQGIPVIPKSSNPKHLRTNFELFDFELSEDEFQMLSSATRPAVAGAGDHETSGDCVVAVSEPEFKMLAV